jgi:hypothetical protein
MRCKKKGYTLPEDMEARVVSEDERWGRELRRMLERDNGDGKKDSDVAQSQRVLFC